MPNTSTGAASQPLSEHNHRAPLAPRFLLRAIRAARGRVDPYPRLVARWTGTDDNGAVPVLFPHGCGFRLQMCLLTHRAFPLPIWWALQFRNRPARYRRVDAGHGFVVKGVEVELHSRLMRASDCYWESRDPYAIPYGTRPPAG